MNLTEHSHKKQIVGIILVVVFLLTVFVYGSRERRKSNGCSAVSFEAVLAPVETVQAEMTIAPVETEAVR